MTRDPLGGILGLGGNLQDAVGCLLVRAFGEIVHLSQPQLEGERDKFYQTLG